MRLSRDCNEIELSPNLEFLNNFGMSLVAVCHELFGDDISHDNLSTNIES